MDQQSAVAATRDAVVESLTHGVIAGPDDLMGMGECINLIEQLEAFSEPAPEHWPGTLSRLKTILTALILENSEDVQRDWQTIHELVRQLGSPVALVSVQAVEAPSAEAELFSAAVAERPLAAPATATEDDAAFGEVQDPELLKDFIEEAREHLSNIELNMLALETNPDDRDAINEVFRPFHSVKGVAGFLNLRDIHELSHEVENLLDEARAGKLTITNAVIDLVLQAVDVLKGLLLDLERPPAEVTDKARSSAVVQAFLNRVKDFERQQGDIDAPVAVRKIGEIMVEQGILEPEEVQDVVAQSRESGQKFGEVVIQEGLAEPREVSQALREQRQVKESSAAVRIDTQKLDSLVDMVGELVIAQAMVLQNPDVQGIRNQKLQQDSVQLRRITTELQRISMAMRMVPIKATFQKMIRLVRDLSKKSGKEVALEMQGEDTEIDRNMVEEIYEPLVHMIRNSADHGIETPEERIHGGKAPQGTIVLAAAQRGHDIVIEIRDDGKGLDAARIRAKAVERGLISEEAHLDEDALYQLIFHPGFSTKEVVTEVSGRGVGMDVVKRSIEKLRGKIEVSSVAGRGSRFQLRLPLTMAIIDGMVTRIGNERYIVPTIALKESLRPEQEAYLTVQGRGELINVRNQLMPLIRLHRIFGVEPRHHNPWDALVLVVGENGSHYCLLVDEILGRQEVVIKSLGGTMRNLLGVSGGAILGDGKVALIIDVKGVVNLFEGSNK
jgi:two-component system, chemotaxis family, sensor kinase CheA